MIRKYFSRLKDAEKEKIRWRSHEPTRIEAFSDSVFAFAISLLVISLEVPKSSKELLEQMLGLVPFAFCFFAIFKIWYDQYKFFRRYGMHDKVTIVLNGILIFFVLAYVYPLKFLFNALMLENAYVIRKEDAIILIVLYDVGICAINYLFSFMYYNAYLKKGELGLTEIEVFETKTHFYTSLYIAVVANVVILITVFGGKYAIDGQACFGLMIFIRLLLNRRTKLFKKKFGHVPMAEPQLGAE